MQLQQLTYLELACKLAASGQNQDRPALRPLQALTSLVDFRFVGNNRHLVLAGMLSGSRGLTRLSCTAISIDPGVFSGHTRLQHLQLQRCVLYPENLGAALLAGVAQLFCHLQELTELTHLDLQGTVMWNQPTAASSAQQLSAFSALVASSKLQHLDMSTCCLPGCVWQHLFPAGWQLQQLHSIDILDI
jgi:hypothetical protein